MEILGFDKSQSDSLFDKMAEKYPAGRAGEPEDIGNLILYLASDEASFITGSIMVADGGHVAANLTLGIE